MEGNFPDILADGFGSRHDDLNQKSDLTLKCVVGFGDEEEEEEVINEEEEETYYHGTQLKYDDLGSHGLERELGRTPTHVEPSLDASEHHTKTMTPIGRPQRKRGVPWYQRTPFTMMQSTPKVKKITKTREKKQWRVLKKQMKTL
ncbi:unnamed protein product [Lactuca virosa]|uniref:Uncharacterized protein n=1 Tax=Lactuca virosa TaxID=75947 RepID=A0AAU9P483_9ASTR|nr:unnamed protein product [Lactuca virosa]